MSPDFSSIYNHHEREVFNLVMDMVPQYPGMKAAACISAAITRAPCRSASRRC